MSTIKKALLIHGAYMSNQDFKELKKYLEKNKVKVLAINLNPKYPKIISYAEYIKNAKKALKTFGKCTVIGISMGGMITSELLNEKNMKKAILLSTLVNKEPNNMKYFLLKIKILPQILSGKIRINPKDLIYKLENKKYEFLEKIKRFEPTSIMKDSGDFVKVFENIKNSKKDIIIVYGDKDYTINIDEVKKLKNIKLKIFKNMSHFLIHEKNRKEVYEFILKNI
jgi:esterase/lipase